MESMQRVIKQLTNDIIDLNKNQGERKKPFKPFMKKRTYSSPQIPPTLGINIKNYAMENHCHTHHENHSQRIVPKFINSFTALLTPSKPPKREKRNEKEEDEEDQDEEEEEEGEGEEPPSHLNLIWDQEEFGDDEDDDIMEEACIGNEYNFRSKGAPKTNDLPSTSKTNNNIYTSKQASTDNSPEKENAKEKEKEKEVIPSKSPIILDLTQKILGDLKLDYDAVEDLKKMKADITIFELCKITQLREQLRGALQHIQIPQDVVVGNSKVTPKEKNVKITKIVESSSGTNTSSIENKEKTTEEEKRPNPRVDAALIGRKSRCQTAPFLLTFEILDINVHNCLVDSGLHRM